MFIASAVLGIASIILQMGAALAALRLIRITGRSTAWILIACGVALMTLRRMIVLLRLFDLGVASTLDLLEGVLSVSISVILFAGILKIRPLFIAIRSSEDALRESDERYRAIVDGFDGLIYICSGDHRIEFMNQRQIDRTGRNAVGEMCYRALRDLGSVCPWCVSERVLAGETVRSEVQDPQDNRWYYVVSTPIHRTDGTVSVQSMILDITERKRAEEDLRSSQLHLQLAVSATNGGVWDVACKPDAPDTISDEMYLSPELKALIGYAADEFPSSMSAWQARILPEDFASVQKSAYDHSAGITPLHEVAYRIRHKDGSIRWLHSRGKLQRDAQGVPVRWTGIDWDVTERRRIEESLQRSEGSVTALLNACTEPIALLDTEGNVLAANTAMCQRLGWSTDQIIGKNLFEVLPPATAKMRIAQMGKCVASGKPLRFEDERDGKAYDNNVYPVRDSAGRVVGVAGFSIDITERKRVENALQRAHAELEQKVADRTLQLRSLAGKLIRVEQKERRRIAHVLHEDLQQVIVATKMRLSALRVDSPEDKRRQTIEQAVQWLERAVQIARGLVLDLRPPILNELGLVPALEWLVGDVREKFGLAVQLEVGSGAVVQSEDLGTCLFESVRELLFNVAKHAGVNSARVRVSVPGPNEICLAVEDDGVGFDPTRNGIGSFGLSSVRERLGLFAGRLDVVSAPGQGTRATMTVPLS